MRFFDSTLVILITQSIGLVSAFLVSVLVSRTLGAEGKGVFSLLLSIATILYGISNLGLGFASQYFISRKPDTFRGQFSNILVFPLIVAAAVVIALGASFSLWQPLLKGLTLPDLAPALVMLPLMLIFEPCCQLLVVLGRIGRRSVAVLSQSGMALMSAAVLLLAGASAVGVSYCYALGWLMGGVVAVVFVIRSGGPPGRPSLPIFGETLRYSIWIYLANLIKGVLLRVDFLFLYSMRAIGEAGVYSVAAALTSGITVIMVSVETSFYPRTSAKTDAEANETTPFYYRQMLIVMALVGIAMAVVARPLLSVFGSAFLSGTVPMLILIVATTIKGLSGILYLHILGRGKAYVMTLVTTVTLLSSALLNSLLVPAWGMNGAATATLISFIGENLVLTILYRRLTCGSIRALYAFNRADLRILAEAVSSVLIRLRDQIRQSGGGR